jgi:hypothetical protein
MGIIAVVIQLDPGYDKGVGILCPFDDGEDTGYFIDYNSFPNNQDTSGGPYRANTASNLLLNLRK